MDEEVRYFNATVSFSYQGAVKVGIFSRDENEAEMLARKKLEQDPLDFIDRDEISLYVCEQDINPDSIVEGEDYMVSHIVEPEDLAEAGLQEEM